MKKNYFEPLMDKNMYRGYHIVANTAAGRRRYMQWLIPYVIACPEIERYDIWVHTHNGADIEFFNILAKEFPKINLVWQPNGEVGDVRTINPFYRYCCEEDTIYMKLDDDVAWMEIDAIKKMIDFRIDNPQHFLVSPLVINNALSTYILQVLGKIKLTDYYRAICTEETLWKNGVFAAQLHQWFIDHYLLQNRVNQLHCGSHPMAMNRFSINNILWFGKDMKKIDGVVPDDDEEFLSSIYPTILGKTNCFNGDAIISHFAFGPQREHLDRQNILEQYGAYLDDMWKNDTTYAPIHKVVQSAKKYADDNEEKLMKLPSPYTKPLKPIEKISIKHKIYRIMPKELQVAWRTYEERHRVDDTRYIF